MLFNFRQGIYIYLKLTNVSQLQFGAGENAGLEENLAAAQQQMQVMQQVIVTIMSATTTFTNIISTITIITTIITTVRDSRSPTPPLSP